MLNAPLDPLLHARHRLAIMSLLMREREAEFIHIKNKLNVSAGNLSVQLQKLKAAGYIDIQKRFGESYPLTNCKITFKGVQAFRKYAQAIRSYIGEAI
ncbi:MAG TPA: transcriptional regulator [Ferruginibacter sp.]|nr:transcriptional regulator [Ferruginibacter sp.]HRO18171.1 transcriptional regulator [Ferruginibacter sp.]HRQ21120.1 transcriptional regulator [Ferruginibacter sp.]